MDGITILAIGLGGVLFFILVCVCGYGLVSMLTNDSDTEEAQGNENVNVH